MVSIAIITRSSSAFHFSKNMPGKKDNMCVIVDETTFEELFTRLNVVEQMTVCIARQLEALSAQLSPVQEAATGLSLAHCGEQDCHLAKLTAREIQVLRLVAQGLTNAEIARQLVLTCRTVNWYLTSIYSKLGVSSRTAAMHFVYERQFLGEKDL